MKRHLNAGFGLIELVITMIIIAILGSVAIPKFVNLSSSALESKNKSIAGALTTAIRGAHIAWNLYGNGNEIGDMQNYLDNTYNFNRFGYPIESQDNQVYGHANIWPPNSNMCARIWNSLLNHKVLLDETGIGNPGVYYYAVTDGDYRVTSASAGICEFIMVQDDNRSISYDSNTGQVMAI